MSFMFEFSPRELYLLTMSILFMRSQAENDNNAPEELAPALDVIHEKLAKVFELRLENEKQFDELVSKSLTDLVSVSEQIINNPNYETENN